ncbi:MAG: peptidoglycan DD-metalloendopeptidase family protein [Parcubacteria group bacterium]|nr:peptidoglycan DD-metalloendopeptidase family protein [Parcubacteria group bacterium]
MTPIKKILVSVLLGFIHGIGFFGKGIVAFLLIFKGPAKFLDNLIFRTLILPPYKAYRFVRKNIFGGAHFRKEIWGKWGLGLTLIILFIFGFTSTIEASSLREGRGTELFFYSLLGVGDEEVVGGIKKEETAKEVISYLSEEALSASPQNIGIPVDYIEEDVALTAFGGTAFIQPIVFVSDESVAPRTEIEKYIVQQGDTASTIARKFSLNINTILWANNLSTRSIIRPGDKLNILPVDGVLYTVKRNDTLSRIATSLGTDSEKIMEFNMLSSASALQIGEKLIVPGGKQQATYAPSQSIFASPAPKSNLGMIWPTTSKRITQYYWWKHSAIDVGGKIGLPIYAVDDGVVEYAGWGTGYGRQILINHQNGIKTRYAHANSLYVKVGDRVEQGQVIMEMGNTGWSTGPHLHFEIYINGRRVNPLEYVR